MRFCSPKRLWLALLLLSVAAGGVRGQWRIVAPNLDEANGEGGCAIHSTNGVLWVGGHSVAFSTDTGKTWTNIGVPIQIGAGEGSLTDLAFANMDTGVVEERITGGGLLLTTNRGGTWNTLPGLMDLVSRMNAQSQFCTFLGSTEGKCVILQIMERLGPTEK